VSMAGVAEATDAQHIPKNRQAVNRVEIHFIASPSVRPACSLSKNRNRSHCGPRVVPNRGSGQIYAKISSFSMQPPTPTVGALYIGPAAAASAAGSSVKTSRTMFYSRTRRHQHLGGISPEAFEVSAKRA
jgi:hypothetical protein